MQTEKRGWWMVEEGKGFGETNREKKPSGKEGMAMYRLFPPADMDETAQTKRVQYAGKPYGATRRVSA